VPFGLPYTYLEHEAATKLSK